MIGAWALGITGTLALAALLLWAWRRSFRWRAAAALRRLERDYRRTGQLAPLLAGLSRLLRAVAQRIAGREPVAGLCGSAWLRFLDETGRTDQFSRGPGRGLVRLPYQDEAALRSEAVEVGPLLALARRWIARAAPRIEAPR